MEKTGNERGLNGTQLKQIALASMIIDHAGILLAPENEILYWSMRFIGRLAFPLYCFLLVEGFCHTRSVGRYLGRLALFAALSEIPFNLLNNGRPADPDHQNVLFTLLLGLLALWGGLLLQNRGQIPLAALWCVCMAGLAGVLRTDYGWAGVALIVFLYRYREDGQMRGITGFATLMLGVSPAELTSIASFALMDRYNGEKGGGGNRWLFYLAYPFHILALWAAAQLIK